MGRAGVTLSRKELERLAQITEATGTWLVVDETYENFLFSGEEHVAVAGPNIIHVFSFSKVWWQLPQSMVSSLL